MRNIIIPIFVGLFIGASFLSIGYGIGVSKTVYAQANQSQEQYVQLGKLYCSNDADPLWVRLIGRFPDHKTEKLISVWVCLEDYEEMDRE